MRTAPIEQVEVSKGIPQQQKFNPFFVDDSSKPLPKDQSKSIEQILKHLQGYQAQLQRSRGKQILIQDFRALIKNSLTISELTKLADFISQQK